MSSESAAHPRRKLITGADTGLGRGVALEFAHAGAAVALHSPFDPAGARSAVDEILVRQGACPTTS